jgi:hypothetical protein
MGAGRPPDYNVITWHPESNTNGKLGVAWLNDKGNITIKLDPGAAISWRDLVVHGVKLLLKPTTAGRMDPRFPPPDPDVPPGGDEIPF